MQSLPIGPGCVKVKILYATLSRTDRRIYNGKITGKGLPITIGRDAVGMVTEVGDDVKKFARGDMVAIMPYIPCHNCSTCCDGEEYKCSQTLVLGTTEEGTMRDFAVFSASDLYKIPENVKNIDALLLDFVETAFDAVSTLELEKGQSLLITGATDMGLIIAQIALYYQFTPILIDVDDEKLELASKLGVIYTINKNVGNYEKKVFMDTAGKLADAAIYLEDGVLSPDNTAMLLKKHGKIAFTDNEFSFCESPLDTAIIINKQLSVYGVTGGIRYISTALNMLANKRVSLNVIKCEEIPFDEVASAIEVGNSDNKKIIVKMP